MKLGPAIRGVFGRYERHISAAYRALYLDLNALVGQIQSWEPDATTILEIGCGEGAVTERLMAAYPYAVIKAIDISARVGRLYSGPTDQVQFVQTTVQEIAAKEGGSFDLIVLSDVLHHVPCAARQEMLEAIRTVLAPEGTFVFKDWEKGYSPIHWLCYASDRWLTGDRVSYMSREEMREMLMECFGQTALVAETRIRPWRNNIATAIRP